MPVPWRLCCILSTNVYTYVLFFDFAVLNTQHEAVLEPSKLIVSMAYNLQHLSLITKLPAEYLVGVNGTIQIKCH